MPFPVLVFADAQARLTTALVISGPTVAHTLAILPDLLPLLPPHRPARGGPPRSTVAGWGEGSGEVGTIVCASAAVVV